MQLFISANILFSVGVPRTLSAHVSLALAAAGTCREGTLFAQLPRLFIAQLAIVELLSL